MQKPNTKTERNKELILKRLSDPQKWTWGELGKFYKIHRTTVQEIFFRDKHLYENESIYSGVGGLSTRKIATVGR